MKVLSPGFGLLAGPINLRSPGCGLFIGPMNCFSPGRGLRVAERCAALASLNAASRALPLVTSFAAVGRLGPCFRLSRISCLLEPGAISLASVGRLGPCLRLSRISCLFESGLMPRAGRGALIPPPPRTTLFVAAFVTAFAAAGAAFSTASFATCFVVPLKKALPLS